ncbi:MAG TPA: double zinc ribbon domain-containing protein [Gemmatimonadales bacterium]|nr:double zinc ribbon domain-containing protein [Gemmatimonadales bacterium]
MPFVDLGRLALQLERALLPPACLLCDEAIPMSEGDALVCALCRSRWRPVPAPVCVRCGAPSPPEGPCRDCESWPPEFGCVRSAVWLDESARRAVHLLKYDGWWRVADAMASPMRTLDPVAEKATLIPVPLGPRRRVQRGYNQAEQLAEALGRVSGYPVAGDVLVRTRETATQTALTPEARSANVSGAFAARHEVAGRVVVVDDVFTTGATIIAAATALLTAGACQVDAVTFARARPPGAALVP